MSTAYDQDFYAWLQEQATLLKAGQLGELDVDHLVEEIESMGASERRELYSRLKVLLAHLLKWEFQPDARSTSWTGSIDEQRDQLEILLSQSPSLRRLMPEAVDYVYPKARRAAHEMQTPVNALPERCPYTLEQILEPEFWPASTQQKA